MKVAIQGQLGSFHHQAAQKVYGVDVTVVPCKTFRDVFETVTRGEADAGVVAIENNIHGPINPTYRLLMEFDVWVKADVRLRIHQCLIATAPVELATLKGMTGLRVRSQAPALEQVDRWLAKHLPNAIREEATDTAVSVAAVVHEQDPTLVAIGGRVAAEMYGGYIVADEIEDEPENFTRFIAFQTDHTTAPEATDCSIIVRTDHTPGALLHALELFNTRGINLTKLDSHPIPGDKQHYRFFVDFASRYDTPAVREIFDGLKEQGCDVKLLGCYTRVN
jgi:prephenate dehydratase